MISLLFDEEGEDVADEVAGGVADGVGLGFLGLGIGFLEGFVFLVLEDQDDDCDEEQQEHEDDCDEFSFHGVLSFEVEDGFGVDFLSGGGVGEGEMEVRAGGATAVAGAADGLSGADVVALMGDKLGEVAVAGFVAVGVLQDHGVAAAVGVVVVGMCDFSGPWGLDRGAYFGSYVDAVVERGGTGDGCVALAEMGGNLSPDGRDWNAIQVPDGLDDEHQQDGEDGEGQGCGSEGAEDVFGVIVQHGSWSSSPSSAPAGSPTDTDMLPCLMVMALRLRTTYGSCASAA